MFTLRDPAGQLNLAHRCCCSAEKTELRSSHSTARLLPSLTYLPGTWYLIKSLPTCWYKYISCEYDLLGGSMSTLQLTVCFGDSRKREQDVRHEFCLPVAKIATTGTPLALPSTCIDWHSCNCTKGRLLFTDCAHEKNGSYFKL